MNKLKVTNYLLGSQILLYHTLYMYAQELKFILLLIVIATLVHYPDTITKLV